MAETFKIRSNFRFDYEGIDPLEVEDVLETLSALVDLIQRTPTFIEAKLLDTKVEDVKIYIESLRSGSFKKDLIIELVFGKRENYDKITEATMQSIRDSQFLKSTLSYGLSALVIYGAIKACGNDPIPQSINNYNTYIINYGKDLDYNEDDIEKILKSIPDTKKLSQNSLKLVNPIKN